MGHNVQSQAGVSLSDVYDVVGGQAPIERLLTTEVPAVHDMASTIFSERLSGGVRRRETGDLGQSTFWDEIINDFGEGITRIMGVAVLVDGLTRTENVSVSVSDPIAGREVPIFTWDNNFDLFREIRVEDAGVIRNIRLLIPNPPTPSLSLLIGTDQPGSTPDIAFRGLTSAFGAGTVEHILVIYTASTAIGGITGYGLPIPGW